MLWPLRIIEGNAEVWMGGLQFYILFNSISDTWCMVLNERLCEYCLKDQLLQLCTAHTAWSDSEIRFALVQSGDLACFGPFRLMYYPRGYEMLINGNQSTMW